MAETLLTIQEVSAITGKSLQTIRRAIRAKKVQATRKKTPQGFNYLITQKSVAAFYKVNLKGYNRERVPGSVTLEPSSDVKKNMQQKSLSTADAFATLNDLKTLEHEVANLLEEYKKEKESFVRFMRSFQEKFVVLENQLKLLEEPKKKSWFAFWK